MAEMLHVGADFFAALDDYVQAVSLAAVDAHQAGVRALHEGLQDEARSHPRWSGLAPHLETWVEDGEVQVGVRTPRLYETALNAEYGDADHAPVPLLRTFGRAGRKAASAMDAVLVDRLGLPRDR